MKKRHEKLSNAIINWCEVRNFSNALKAMDFAKQYHTGTRKDGETPEFFHQVEIALYVSTLAPHLTYAEETICAAFLHDVVEDYHVEYETIVNLFDTNDFGIRVADAVFALSKEIKGVKKTNSTYMEEVSKNEIASIVKGTDRIKKAQKTFTNQNDAYENIKYMLKSQISLITSIHEAL